MSPLITPGFINSLKSQARKLTKLNDLKHSKNLDFLASNHGFKNWSQLMKAFGTTACPIQSPTPGSPAPVHGEFCFPPFKRTRWKHAEVISLDPNKKQIHVCTIRHHPQDGGNRFFGHLIFRCPVCNSVHYHGAVGPKLGAGNGDRIPHCSLEHPSAFHFYLHEVVEPERAGHIPQNILKDIIIP